MRSCLHIIVNGQEADFVHQQEGERLTVREEGISVTRWLHYLFNFWLFTGMNIPEKAKIIPNLGTKFANY